MEAYMELIRGIFLLLLPTLMLIVFVKGQWDTKKKLRRLKKENHSISDYIED